MTTRPQLDLWNNTFGFVFGIGMLAAFVGVVTRGGRMYDSLEEELESIRFKLMRLDRDIENTRDVLVSRREHRIELMREYGLTVIPSSAEMRAKYPRLYATSKYLQSNEHQLERLEVRRLLLMKRKKEIRIKLGLRPEEVEVEHKPPAKKKYEKPPPWEPKSRY